MVRGLGQGQLTRLGVGTATVLLACGLGAHQLTATADDQAHPRARAGVDLAQPAAPATPDQPWLTGDFTTRSGGLLAPRPAAYRPGHHAKPRQEVTGPKGSRVWVPSLLTDTGIPYAASHAYHHAAATMARLDPACHIPWTLLAAIGRVESDHGQYGGAVLDAHGISHPEILGVPLNGHGRVAAIPDTDNGTLDHDTVWDRAVGPMQFLPSTWQMWARDGDGDGVMNPNDINDAALAAAGYLCAGGQDVAVPAQMRVAIYSYNQSNYYVALVMAFQRGYQTGVFVLPPPPHPARAHAAKAGTHAKAGKHAKPGDKSGHRGAHRPSKPGRRPTGHQGGTVVEAAAGPGGGSTPLHSPSTASGGSGSPGSTPKPSGSGSSSSSSPSSSPSGTPSSSPSGTPSSSPSGSPSSSPSGSPSSSPSGSGSPTLTLVPVSGTLAQCGTDWCIGDVTLDVGPDTQLAAAAAHDYDGDGTLESNADELAGLAGTHVTLLVTQGTGTDTVYTIDGLDYRFADGSFAR